MMLAPYFPAAPVIAALYPHLPCTYPPDAACGHVTPSTVSSGATLAAPHLPEPHRREPSPSKASPPRRRCCPRSSPTCEAAPSPPPRPHSGIASQPRQRKKDLRRFHPRLHVRRHLIIPEIAESIRTVFLPPRLHRQRHPLSRLHRACGKRKGRCNLIQLPNDRQRYLTAAGNSAAPPVAVQRERRQSAVIIAGGHVPRQLSRLTEAEYADARSVRPHRHRVLAVVGNGAGDVSLDHPIAQGRPLPRCAPHGEGGILCAGDQRLVSRKRGRSMGSPQLLSAKKRLLSPFPSELFSPPF